MPELPEVEVVRRGLEAHVVGRRITEVEVLHPRSVRRHLTGPAAFADSLADRDVLAARRRGKYLWLALDGDDAVLGHLGMSGQMLVQQQGAPDERHLRLRFTLDDGHELRFVDQRMFGGLMVSSGGAVAPLEIAHIALDPLDAAFDLEAVTRRVRRRASAVKRVLLDQTVVSGIGNIYADEGLWRARVHGEREARRLGAGQVRELLTAVSDVMVSALDQGGTSFDALYVNVNGQSGYFERSLEVYGREGQACRRCGAAVARVPFTNRSSYFCPRCQPAPRRARRTASGTAPSASAGVQT